MDVISSVAATTSNDELYPAENMLDIKEKNFWMTTGIFPQMVILSLKSKTKVKEVKLVSSGLKSVLLESSPDEKSSKFETAVEMNLPTNDGQIQITKLPLNGVACHQIKLTILSGYDHFVAIYKLIIEPI